MILIYFALIHYLVVYDWKHESYKLHQSSDKQNESHDTIYRKIDDIVPNHQFQYEEKTKISSVWGLIKASRLRERRHAGTDFKFAFKVSNVFKAK